MLGHKNQKTNAPAAIEIESSTYDYNETRAQNSIDKKLIDNLKDLKEEQQKGELKSNEKIARFLYNIGNIYCYKGQLDKSLQYLDLALKYTDKTNSNQSDKVKILNGLGNLYKAKNEPDQALKFYKKAINLDLKFTNSSIRINLLNNISDIYSEKGDLDKALKLKTLALRIQQKQTEYDPLKESRLISKVANEFSKKGNFDKALEYYQQALEIRQKKAPDSILSINTLNNIGNIYFKKGDFDKALENLNKSLKITTEKFPASNGFFTALNIISQVTDQIAKSAKANIDKQKEFIEANQNPQQETSINSLNEIYVDTNSSLSSNTLPSEINETRESPNNSLRRKVNIWNKQNLSESTITKSPQSNIIEAFEVEKLQKEKVRCCVIC